MQNSKDYVKRIEDDDEEEDFDTEAGPSSSTSTMKVDIIFLLFPYMFISVKSFQYNMSLIIVWHEISKS